MKVGFIGTGRMGEAMVRRLLAAKHDVGVYNRTAAKAKPLVDAGAKAVGSIADAARYGDAVYTMLADDAALSEVLMSKDGLLDTLPKGGIHICAGTHGVRIIRASKDAHAEKGQILICAPMIGRPELVSSGTAGIVAAGPAEAMAKCKPAFDAIGRRTYEASTEPEAAAALKLTNNFVLGCAIEAMGEGFSLMRKYGVQPNVLYELMTDFLFNCSAYKVYGKIIVDESYATVGQMAALGLKDANLAIEAAGMVNVPLPSGNVWRDRLVGAVAHGDGDKDWAVMALEQARASGLA
jgi:3-hydroxyisobutyrate dehydrogenase-like beta-hydroxyacid dehydrogenase